MKKGSAGNNGLVVSSQNKPANRNFMARKSRRKIFALERKFLLGRFQDELELERMFSFEQTKFWICQLEKLQEEYWGGKGEVYFMVGVTGFEPATSCSQNKRATRLRYTPPEKTYLFIVSTRNSKKNLIRYPEQQFQIGGGSSDEPVDRSLSLQSEFRCGSYPVCSATPALSYLRRCLASGFHPLDC